MKAFRTYKAAKEAAKGLPVLEIESGSEKLFIAFDNAADPLAVSEARVTLVNTEGFYCGNVNLRHLDRLGDADHARPGPVPATERCFSYHDLGEPEPRPMMVQISKNVWRKA